ncbi:MAG: glycosyltransferase family 2 protein [Patescibacteria group bacterium]
MQEFKYYPKVSFIMGTLNAERTLRECLASIRMQNYPQEKIEIVLADGGSTDKTLKIAKKYGADVVENKLVTSESGKAVALKASTGELICSIDSDNILPTKSWLKKMVKPLVKNPSYIGSEAIRFTYRKEDGYIDRYCALIGMNDPLCMWLGTYDRINTLTGKWTGLPVKYKKKNGYIEVLLEHGNIPTIGANGFMLRKSIFEENSALVGEYLFDVDLLEMITANKGPQKFAKVYVGVIHLYCGSSLKRFSKKQLRRVKDYLYRRNVSDVFITNTYNDRSYTYGQGSALALFKNILRFAIETVLVFPLLIQSIRGYLKVKDKAWFAHIILCWLTLLMYMYGTVQSFFSRKELSRENWKQ